MLTYQEGSRELAAIIPGIGYVQTTWQDIPEQPVADTVEPAHELPGEVIKPAERVVTTNEAGEEVEAWTAEVRGDPIQVPEKRTANPPIPAVTFPPDWNREWECPIRPDPNATWQPREKEWKPGPPPPPPVISITAADFWSRLTDEEAEALDAEMQNAPLRMRKLYASQTAFASDDQLWPTLLAAATKVLGKKRVGEVLI